MLKLDALQRHTCERPLTLPSKAADVHRSLCKALREASDRRLIVTPPGEIHKLVQLIDPPPNVASELVALGRRNDAYCIVGGTKNQKRTREASHIERDDGAWFDFSITVQQRGRQELELLAYDFEIRFSPEMGTPFLRFDYNLPDHRNEGPDLRSHLHPGCDDVLLPAPLMSPQEMLTLFLEGLRMPTARGNRGVSDFEVGWLRDRLERVSPRPASPSG